MFILYNLKICFNNNGLIITIIYLNKIVRKINTKVT